MGYHLLVGVTAQHTVQGTRVLNEAPELSLARTGSGCSLNDQSNCDALFYKNKL